MDSRSDAADNAIAIAVRAATLDKIRAENSCDVVVVGAGATGSFASWLLTEAGLRVLLLDAGVYRSPRSVRSRRLVYRTYRRILGRLGLEAFSRRRQLIQADCYAWTNAPDAFVDDIDNPYVTPDGCKFVWLRARQLGGRIMIPGFGRQYYRLGPDDFNANDGLSPAWPFKGAELDQWYACAERHVELAGMRDNISWLPDGQIMRAVSPTELEKSVRDAIIRRWPAARPILSRYGNFNALELAAKTGRLLIRSGAIARKIEVDASGSVSGVTWVDRKSRAQETTKARLVFLCASALESTRLLLLSRSPRNPDGIGASSGVLGRFLMDHIRIRAFGNGPPTDWDSSAEPGRCFYIPRFDARTLTIPSGRGFGVQFVLVPGGPRFSHFDAACFGEMVPRADNRVSLHPNETDAWGIPVLSIDCRHDAGDLNRAKEEITALRELAQTIGITLRHIDEMPTPPGSANHECGTARMGTDPSNSVLDANNECWDAKGLYLTDGACLPSQGTQNPTLTLLALTARACDRVVRNG